MTDLDWVRYFVDEAPFVAVLGIRVNKLSNEEADLSLGFKDELSNGDTARSSPPDSNSVGSQIPARWAPSSRRSLSTPHSG